MDKKKIYQSFAFLIIGLGVLWWVYRDADVNKLKAEIAEFNLFWILVSVALNIISQLVRTHRWKQLFKPLNYNPGFFRLFLAIIILGFTNLIIPRGGEFARLAAIHKSDKIPFPKLFGIAIAERLTDLTILIILFLFLVLWQFQTIKDLLELPSVQFKDISNIQNLLIFAAIIFVIIILLWAANRFNWFKKVKNKLVSFKEDIREGISSVKKLKNKSSYIFQSLSIYLLWVLMLYVLFFAYPPTEDLSFKAAALTFGLATMAFLLPIQAGMGAWHFIVIQCLLLFGIDNESSKAFSLVAHAVINLVFLLPGLIVVVAYPIMIHKNKS